MTGYASNQFYNFETYEGAGKSISRKPDDNANFNYPGRQSTPLFTVKTGGRQDYTSKNIQRGFIRGIYPAALGKVASPGAGKVKQRRLFFQFNPTTLDRSVAMSTSVLNPLLQDPSNLLQPVPGSADFNFSILFNRESEVVSAEYSTSSVNSNGDFGKTQSSPLTQDLNEYGGNVKQGDVSSLGVLADLYVLDSIIGQSITQDMVEFLKDYWNNASTLSQSSYDSSEGGASFSFDSTKFETTVSKNLGNTAFLSPLPIRIVFSSLFMVEGFVTSSTVEFIKFTSNYVPTICRVNLSVRSLYMGFAKEKAYLTDALETAVAQQAADRVADNALAVKMKKLIKNGTFFNYKMTIQDQQNESFTIAADGVTNTRHSETVKNNTLTDAGVGDDGGSPGKFVSGFERSTFKHWWNLTNQDAYRDFFDIITGGTLTSAVSHALKQAVENEGVTWTYSAKFEIIVKGKTLVPVIGPTITPIPDVLADRTTVIMSAPLVFTRKNGGNHPNGAQDVANNANNKSVGDGEKNDDRWACNRLPSEYLIRDGDVVTFAITHDYALQFTGATGAQTVPYSYVSEHTFKANSVADWSYINGGNVTWRMYEIER
jgi:hypothetical protein